MTLQWLGHYVASYEEHNFEKHLLVPYCKSQNPSYPKQMQGSFISSQDTQLRSDNITQISDSVYIPSQAPLLLPINLFI